jgi:hypothetical protein
MKKLFRNAALGLAIAAAAAQVSVAQSEQHGRKWQPLPPTAHIVVTVVKGFNGKPLPNAAVVFHAVRDGRNDGNLEVKTDPEGKATIDVIEQGSNVTVQVIANGFATSATELYVDGPTKELEIKLQRPRAQVSEYTDNDGKPAQVKPGIQESAHVNATTTMTATPGNSPVDPTKPTAVPAGNPTQLPGPLNAPAGTQTLPTQPGAPVTTVPPVAPTSTGTQPIPPQ